MLHIDRLCAYVQEVIDKQYAGTYFPQNPEYVCTSQMVKEIAEAYGKKICLTKLFNPLLHLLSGRFAVIDKAFGNLVYAEEQEKIT